MLATWANVFSGVFDASTPMTRRSALPRERTPAIIPACVEPVTVQTMTMVEEHTELRLLRRDFTDPVREAETTQGMIRGACWDRVGLARPRPRPTESA
jgi:hypothetical protein